MTRQTAADMRETAKVLLYGKPKTGKTSALATLANGGRTVFVNAEGGFKPTALVRLGVDLTNIEIHDDNTYEGLEGLYYELASDLADDPESWYGMMWDSTTETSKLMVETLMDRRYKRTSRADETANPFEMTGDEWQVLAEQMTRLIRRFKNLPIHVGISALERRDQDDDGSVAYGPAVSPAVQGNLMGYVDIIGHTYTEVVPGWGDSDEMFIAQFRGGGKYQVGDRFGVLPPRMIEPTMERIIGYINGDLTRDTDERQLEGKQALFDRPTPEPVAPAPDPGTGTDDSGEATDEQEPPPAAEPKRTPRKRVAATS